MPSTVQILVPANATPFAREFLLSRQPQVPVRAINRAFRAGLKSLAWHWWRNFAPLHFKHGNSTRYSYGQRSPAWTERKGGLPDLVFTGRAKNMVLGTRPRDPVAVSTLSKQHVSIVVNIPRYLKLKKINGVPLSQEVVMHNAEEDRQLFEVFKRKVDSILFGSSSAEAA